MMYFFGNGYTDSKRTAHELQIIKEGDTHKWWTSARLILGLSEKEAQELHYKINNPTVFHQTGVIIENRREGDKDENAIDIWADIWAAPVQDEVSYVEALLDRGRYQ